MKIASLLLLPSVALSQAPLRQVTGPLCSLQLRQITTSSSLERTNDWTIVTSTSNTLWPPANLLLTLNSTLYGGNGQLCSFSPHFRCQSQSSTIADSDFKILQNGSVALGGETMFWYCPDPDGDAHHTVAAPLIYPPKGVLDEDAAPDYQSCNSTLLYTDVCLNQSDFRLNPQSISLNADSNEQDSSTAGTARLMWSSSAFVFWIAASFSMYAW